MTIWILAILIMASVSLAGWRQGAIRASIAFVGIIIAALLASPLGRLFHPLLPHLGFSPLTSWALAPVVGFIVASIPFKVAAHHVHHRIEHFYKYKAGELRMLLWTRLNSRLGICVGLMNGAVYFILISFFVFNLTYWTTQAVGADAVNLPLTVRLANNLGDGLQSTGFSKAASVVRLQPMYYQLADLAGTLMQNPALGPKLADYPGLTSLWHRDDMQPLVTDPLLTNALAAGSSLAEVAKLPSVQAFFASKDLTRLVWGVAETNLDDINTYLTTGKSAKYTEPILGDWEFNAGVTLAWLRQAQPKMSANEMAGTRALWAQAYAPTTLLLTGQNEVFIARFPKFGPPTQPNQPPFEGQDWKGDWARDGANYTFHVVYNGQDKYLSATTDGLRLKIKDGRNLLIFDHAN